MSSVCSRVLVACVCSAFALGLLGCTTGRVQRTFEHTDTCVPLNYDRRDAVGAFISLPRNPTESRDAEMAPERIRALTGERVVWIFRNPGDVDLRVSLYRVWRKGDESKADIKTRIFGNNLGGEVLIAKGCRYGVLRAQVDTLAAAHGVCARDTLHYEFMINVGTTLVPPDTPESRLPILRFPYDPELVVEGEP